MAWLLGYLLFGFFLHWAGYRSCAARGDPPPIIEWYWELIAIATWPLVLIVVSLPKSIRDKMKNA